MEVIRRMPETMHDQDLRVMMGELELLESEDVLPNGKIRALEAKLAAEGRLYETDASNVVRSGLVRLAGARWLALAPPDAEDLPGRCRNVLVRHRKGQLTDDCAVRALAETVDQGQGDVGDRLAVAEKLDIREALAFVASGR